jgi:CheY-like chemotaxis protein
MLAGDARPILVVEDSDEDFDTVREALKKSGRPNALWRATTGGKGLELLRSAVGGAVRPALVLMDLNTPGIDGREALETIKTSPMSRELPVVVLTTSANVKDLAFCYRVGANAYHVKPIRYADHIQVLLAVFTYWLGAVALPCPDWRTV